MESEIVQTELDHATIVMSNHRKAERHRPARTTQHQETDVFKVFPRKSAFLYSV